MDLRPYQITAIESARCALTKGDSVVIQMPTGAGKTKVASAMLAGTFAGAKVKWFICHRREIVRQVVKAFDETGIDFGVVSPAMDERTNCPYKFQPEKLVQIISIGSLPRRLAALPKPDLAFWDECHHTPAKSWAELREQISGAKHIGLTATPERLDGKGLREWFDELIVGPSIVELVADGYLSPFRYFAPSEPDLSAAKMQAGDYRKTDLSKIMNTPVLIGDAVSEYRAKIDGKRAIAFCASVEASQALVARFNGEGIPAKHVDGNTPGDERDAAVKALATGEISVLSNVEVFTEGFDVPAIEAVILMRPTKSPTLLLQMIGRALRVNEGKDVAYIMDHAGLHRDHGWFADSWQWSLDGGAAKARRAAGGGVRRCPECKEVHAERSEVCACGYEFPTGREIGEFDGVLREVGGGVPDGCETFAQFARRCGTKYKVVWQFTKRGLPHIAMKFVPVAPGLDWVKGNSRLVVPPKGSQLESDKLFAARFGMQRKVASRWRKMGAPHIKTKMVLPDALQWVKENIDLSEAVEKSKNLSNRRNPPHGFETMHASAKRHGVSSTTIKNYIKKGVLPSRLGYVDIAAADEFMAIYHPRDIINHSSRSLIFQKIKSGEPVETAARFGVRINITAWAMSVLIKGGIPYGGRLGGIPIQAGLEWVRDNRPDITIPPEAWPTSVADNDNHTTTNAAMPHSRGE